MTKRRRSKDSLGARSSTSSLAAGSNDRVNQIVFEQCILRDLNIVKIANDDSEEFQAFATPAVFAKSSKNPYSTELQYALDTFSEIIQDELQEVKVVLNALQYRKSVDILSRLTKTQFICTVERTREVNFVFMTWLAIERVSVIPGQTSLWSGKSLRQKCVWALLSSKRTKGQMFVSGGQPRFEELPAILSPLWRTAGGEY
jgi:hypothetical protein